MRARGAVVVLPLLLFAACGDDTDTDADIDVVTTTTSAGEAAEPAAGADRDAYVAAVADDIGSDAGAALAEVDAKCVAGAIVDAVGADELDAAGFTPEEFADAESFDDVGIELDSDARDRLAGALGECDLAESIARAFSGGVSSEGFELSDEAIACVTEEFRSNVAFASAIVDSLVGDDDAAIEEITLGAMAGCPDMLVDLLVAGIESEAGEPLSPEAITCIGDIVRADPDGAVAATQGDASGLGQQIVDECGALLAPGAGG